MQSNVIAVKEDYQLNYLYSANMVDCTNGNIIISMDSIGDAYGDGVHFYIIKTDKSINTITLLPYSGELINGVSKYVMLTYKCHIMSYQGIWYLLSE